MDIAVRRVPGVSQEVLLDRWADARWLLLTEAELVTGVRREWLRPALTILLAPGNQEGSRCSGLRASSCPAPLHLTPTEVALGTSHYTWHGATALHGGQEPSWEYPDDCDCPQSLRLSQRVQKSFSRDLNQPSFCCG